MMDRDDILRRMVTGAEYLERTNLTSVQREKAWARYNELEEELNRVKELERQAESMSPDQEAIQGEKDKIRSILQPGERNRRRKGEPA